MREPIPLCVSSVRYVEQTDQPSLKKTVSDLSTFWRSLSALRKEEDLIGDRRRGSESRSISRPEYGPAVVDRLHYSTSDCAALWSLTRAVASRLRRHY